MPTHSVPTPPSLDLLAPSPAGPIQAAPARRGFLARLGGGALALAAGAFGATGLDARPLRPSRAGGAPPDEYLGSLAGKHRQFFDATSVNDGFALAYAMTFLNTSGQTYKLKDGELSAIVGLRHFAIPMAFTDAIWAKYKLGEFAKTMDPATKAPATRNIFFNPREGDLRFPDMAIDKLQPRGVHFTVCNVALTVLSGALGAPIGVSPEEAAKEWRAGLIPGMVLVPSGVFAANRAQEKGCTYCYAG